MKKTKRYQNTFFKAAVLKRAVDEVLKLTPQDREKRPDLSLMIVSNKEGRWKFDDQEEFFSEYKVESYSYFTWRIVPRELELTFDPPDTEISVEAPTRKEIETVFNIFEDSVSDSKLPAKTAKPPVIFVGHGGSRLWRDLKDHLQDKHGYKVEAYEIGSRAGHTIRDILEEMMEKSSVAFLVLTGEDETADKKLLARQNVVHETGLFQGKLGFSRAIVLLEEGTEEFSNLAGIQQIRFSKGNIKETFGEVLAVLRREFNV